VAAAERIMRNMDDARIESEHIPRDPKAYAELLEERFESERRRYQKKYHVDAYDPRNFDIAIDTAKNDIDEVARLVIDAYRHRLSATD